MTHGFLSAISSVLRTVFPQQLGDAFPTECLGQVERRLAFFRLRVRVGSFFQQNADAIVRAGQ